jgi:hypothetical protein
MFSPLSLLPNPASLPTSTIGAHDPQTPPQFNPSHRRPTGQTNRNQNHPYDQTHKQSHDEFADDEDEFATNRAPPPWRFPRWLRLPSASWRCSSLSSLFLLFGFDKGERENCGREGKGGERRAERREGVFFYVYYIHLDRYSRALCIRLYCSI